MSEGACDGFNIMPLYFLSQLDVFVEQVVLLLQKSICCGRTMTERLREKTWA
jgi:hypothetical protein